MAAADAYALGLALLGGWGIFAARKTSKLAGRWSPNRARLLAGEGFFVGSCWLPAAGLYWGWFAPWMLAPLGVCYLGMIPMPCYFEAVDRIGWLHAARNALFILLALACFAVAGGFLPLSLLGL